MDDSFVATKAVAGLFVASAVVAKKVVAAKRIASRLKPIAARLQKHEPAAREQGTA
jgi:hypothetical protein